MSGRKNPKHFVCIRVFGYVCVSVDVSSARPPRRSPWSNAYVPDHPEGPTPPADLREWEVESGRSLGREGEGWRASDGKAKKAELVLRIFRGVSVAFFWVVCHSRSKSKIIRHESPLTILRRGPTGCSPPTRTPTMPAVRHSMPNSDVRQDATVEISPRNIINRVSTDHCPQVCSVMSLSKGWGATTSSST